jgi:hypothetical protein
MPLLGLTASFDDSLYIGRWAVDDGQWTMGVDEILKETGQRTQDS